MRYLFVPLLSAGLLWTISALAQPIAPLNFLRPPAFSHAEISPNGHYLAVQIPVKDKTNRFQLVVLDLSHYLKFRKWKVRARLTLRDDQVIGGFFWANDRWLLTSIATRFGGFDRPQLTGALWGTDMHTGRNILEMGYQHRSHHVGVDTGSGGSVAFKRILWLPETKSDTVEVAGLIYGSGLHGTRPIAYKLNVSTAKLFRIAQSPISNGGLMADHSGAVRIAWGTNATTGWPEVYYRKTGNGKWANESKLIGNKEAAAALQTGGPIMFGSDNKTVYFENWTNNPAETMGLYSYDLGNDNEKLLYANPTVDIGSAIESFSRKKLVGVNIMPGKPEILALNPKAPRIQLLAALRKALPNVQINITSWTRDGSEAIVRTWSDTKPPNFYLYTSKPKPTLTFLFKEVPWIKSDDLSPMKPISFKSRDGLTVHGYLTLPRGRQSKNLPMVVYVHGGPHGIRTNWGYDPNSFDSISEQILANHGYAVLSLNYRGSGGYGFKFLKAGFRHWGSTMQNDLADGVAWAIKQGYANPQRVCVFGGSYGGYAALMSSERFPNLYKCAVGYDGCYDLALGETRASDTSRFASGRLYLTTVLGRNPKVLKAFSPAFHADKLKIPVFLLHGGRDVRCPVGGYDEMVAAIKKHGTSLQTLYYRNEGHGFYKLAHREKAWREILAFFGKYIGSGATASVKADQ